MTPPFLIRPFNPSDAEALANLHRRAILAVPDRYYSLADRQSWAHGITPDWLLQAAKTRKILVAHDAAGVLGFCSHGASSLDSLYIEPRHQGRGIGSTLLTHAEAAMSDRSITVDASLSAVVFYERHGYETYARLRWRTRGGREIGVWQMEKRK